MAEPRVNSWAKKTWTEWVRPIGTMALLVFGLRSAVADWNDVPTGSMEPTILVGDRVWVNRLAYDLKVPFTTWHVAEWSEPKSGEIVIFYSPADGQRLVKRVVGVPGDRVELRGGRLFLNETPTSYSEPKEAWKEAVDLGTWPRRTVESEALGVHTHAVALQPDRPAVRDFGPVTVPEGCFFMMGDNRDNSFDSRFFGCVPRSSILGQATAVVASVDPAHHYLPRWNRWCTKLD
ncbi:MAG: signal peptidase I [Verrucomicrobiales bacterium]|nr:signal peptidase I [Verrucomicrobiales bacterium]